MEQFGLISISLNVLNLHYWILFAVYQKCMASGLIGVYDQRPFFIIVKCFEVTCILKAKLKNLPYIYETVRSDF